MSKPILQETRSASLLREIIAQGPSLYEVWDGQLKEKPMTSMRHNEIAERLMYLLMLFVFPRRLGHIRPPDALYVVEGNRQKIEKALRPDISFVPTERLVNVDKDDFHYFAPDLAIEIISSSERPHEIATKVKTYLDFGTRQVWVIYPDDQKLVVHLADQTSTTYTANDTLIMNDILVGFEIAIADIFTSV